MYRNKITLSLVVAAVALFPSSASAAEYRQLCTSASRHCTYTGPDAPHLSAAVCVSTSGFVRVKSTAPCPADAWPYFVEYGEVTDPLTGQVEAYIPLDDACSQPGMCFDGPAPDGSQAYPMCCFVNQDGVEVCVGGVSCGGTLWFCHDGVSNLDGTITCFASEQLG